MNDFYQYTFVSPEPIYAEIKEQLKSYFETGMVDDVMFPIWTRKALRKLSKAALPIKDTVLYISDYSAKLPSGFDSVREAWACTDLAPVTIRRPGAYYSQVISLMNPESDPCEGCDPCTARHTELIYKANTYETFTNRVSHLLKPGNTSAIRKCQKGCPNLASESSDIFTIEDCKFHTNFREGDVYLIYYDKDVDEDGNYLVPDNEKIMDFVDKYIRCEVFYQLVNQTTDETYNQMMQKYQMAEAKKHESWTAASNETVKRTMRQSIAAMNRDSRRLRKYITR